MVSVWSVRLGLSEYGVSHRSASLTCFGWFHFISKEQSYYLNLFLSSLVIWLHCAGFDHVVPSYNILSKNDALLLIYLWSIAAHIYSLIYKQVTN